MRFNATKCYVMSIAQRPGTTFMYQLNNTLLKSVSSNSYLGILFSDHLTWNQHINNITKKAISTLGFIRRNLRRCPTACKKTVYPRPGPPPPRVRCHHLIPVPEAGYQQDGAHPAKRSPLHRQGLQVQNSWVCYASSDKARPSCSARTVWRPAADLPLQGGRGDGSSNPPWKISNPPENQPKYPSSQPPRLHCPKSGP